MLEERIQEVSEFLNEKYEETSEKIMVGEKIAKDSWNSFDPRTGKERKEWYQKTSAYLYDLSKSHELNQEIKKTYGRILETCKHKGGKILDFGAGIGDLVVLLAENGLDMTYLDIKGATSKFAKWRIKRRGLKVNFMETGGEQDCLKEYYDVIICVDVLEHLDDPLFYLKEMHKHLKESGLLILKADPTYTDSYPMHLKKYRTLLLNLSEAMRRIGFEQMDDIVMKKSQD